MSIPTAPVRPKVPAGAPRFAPADVNQRTVHHLDPVIKRKKGVASNARVWFMAAGGVLFGAYIFNVGGTQTFLDSLFGGLYAQSQTQEQTSAVEKYFNGALPYIGVVIVAIILFIIFRAMTRGVKSGIQTRQLKKREVVTLEDFIAEAHEHQVGQKIAREMYKLLLPYCRGKMRARMDDHLVQDLKLSRPEVEDLYGTLLMNTDRKKDMLGEEAETETVLQMLVTVQQSPRRSVLQSAVQPVLADKPAALGPRARQMGAVAPARTQTPVFVAPARLPKAPPAGSGPAAV